MSAHGWRWPVAVLGLVALAAGCRSVPPAPEGAAIRPSSAASSDGGYNDDTGGGWLQDRLWGPRAGSSSSPPAPSSPVRPSSTAQPDGAVRPASAAEPLAARGAFGQGSAIPVYDADAYDVDDGPLAKKKEDENPPGFDLSDLAPDRIFENIKVAAGFGPDRELAKKYYEEGWDLYQQKRYGEAAAKFRKAAGRWPDSLLEEDSLFMAMESHFFANEYAKSFDTASNLLKKHDNTRHLDKVSQRLFAIARYWEQLHRDQPHWPVTPNLTDAERPRFDTLGNAQKAYEMVAMHDPTGPLADDALMALGNSHFLIQHYEEAAFQYDRVRKDYPNSVHIVEAHLLGMKAKELMYQGPMYDSTPLEDAREIADSALRQFSRELGEERAKVMEARNRFDAKLAERDWQMAQFYEIKRQYGAARYYYQLIIKDYAGTKMAQEAKNRLAAIAEFPDKPPERFKFLTRLFPDGR